MADTTDPQNQSGQHNRGPGVFIAGNVYGDVNNHQTGLDQGRDDESRASRKHQRSEKESPLGQQPEEADETKPGDALLGWALLTVWLLGASVSCVVAAFTAPQTVGGYVGAILGAVLFALGGLVPLAFVFTALTEVCAAGTANAADSARKRWVQGQRAAARLNLRYAVSAARAASVSAVLAGFTTGLFGFLDMGKRAADRAHDAHEHAESEIASARSVFRQNLDGG